MIKIATWNVNSVNSRLERALRFLERESPDILCLQELKCVEEKFPLEPFGNLGYDSSIFGQKTYNGVALITKKRINNLVRGFQDQVEDPAARFISGEYDIGGKRLVVASAYIPNGQEVGAPQYHYKLQWLERLLTHHRKYDLAKDWVVVAGDFNVAPEARDVHDPAAWEGKILYSEPERQAFRTLTNAGFDDVFRLVNPGLVAYSWWDYRSLSFPFNKGLRIDFVLASKGLSPHCRSVRIDREERKGEKPSDHAPVIAEFDI